MTGFWFRPSTGANSRRSMTTEAFSFARPRCGYSTPMAQGGHNPSTPAGRARKWPLPRLNNHDLNRVAASYRVAGAEGDS